MVCTDGRMLQHGTVATRVSVLGQLFLYISLHVLLRVQPLRLTPGSVSKVRHHLCVSMPSLALASSGMLLV